MKISTRIRRKKMLGEQVAIPYIVCGDGGFEKTRKLLDLIECQNPAAIEIGIPFSDSSSDGETIQSASKRAIDSGTNINNIIEFLQGYNVSSKIPKIIMTYLNPVIKFGVDNFFREISLANVSGLIIPDLPVEEYEMINSRCEAFGVEIISLIAPNTTDTRIKYIESRSGGFLYLVTVNGTTGARENFDGEVFERIKRIKSIVKLPLVAGFGISTRDHILAMNKVCDGAIVGSRIVKLASDDDFDGIVDLLTMKTQK
ncbi:MAG: tryptophan synthase subunit alpha [Acidaminobacteraceae bacterium]